MTIFSFMYDRWYDEFCDVDIAIKLEKIVNFDELGSEVRDDSPNILGEKSKYQLTHPEYLLFVNEAGYNTNDEKDVTIKKKRWCHRNNQHHQVVSSSDHH